METQRPVPNCPGCHFGCQLNDYQCARGEMLFGKWCNGEEIPQRRMPRPGGKPQSGGPRPDRMRTGGVPPFLAKIVEDEAHRADALALLVTLVSRRVYTDLPPRGTAPFGSQAEPNTQLLEALKRHEGAASAFVVCGRTSLDEETVEEMADAEAAAGTITIEEYEDGTVFMRLTDAGEAALEELKDEKSSFNEDVFGGLTNEEQSQLSELLLRIVEA